MCKLTWVVVVRSFLLRWGSNVFFFSFCYKKLCCRYSFELPKWYSFEMSKWDDSNVFPQHMVLWQNKLQQYLVLTLKAPNKFVADDILKLILLRFSRGKPTAWQIIHLECQAIISRKKKKKKKIKMLTAAVVFSALRLTTALKSSLEKNRQIWHDRSVSYIHQFNKASCKYFWPNALYIIQDN